MADPRIIFLSLTSQPAEEIPLDWVRDARHLDPSPAAAFPAGPGTGMQLLATGPQMLPSGEIREGALVAVWDEMPLPSPAAIRFWLAEHDWKVIGTGPGGSLHRSLNGVEVGVPHDHGYARGIAYAVERIAEAEGRDVTELTRELRNLSRGDGDA
jgi:hypothetical protein